MEALLLRRSLQLKAFGRSRFYLAVYLLPAATSWFWLSSCSAVRSLRMICLGLWRLRFMVLLLAKSGR